MAQTAEYPTHYASHVVLRDGSTLYLRPVRSDDGPGLVRLFEKLSAESRYNRFLSAVRMDRSRADALCQIDYVHNFVLVAELAGEIVAVGQYKADTAQPDHAEVAFAISEALQGRGVGTRLLERLADIAREHRFRAFDAYVRTANEAMAHVFADSGFEQRRHREGATVIHVVLSLEQTPAFLERAATRSQHAACASLKPFFEPRAVAVVGASSRRGRIGSEIFHNIRAAGFRGDVVPVNREATAIDGVPAFARVSDIPGPIDLAVIAVPCEAVADVVEDCLLKGVHALLVISAGFGETGGIGREREAALLNKVRAAGVRMIGPNCMGVINTNPAVRLNATFSPVYPPDGRVAFSTQSGALGLAILDYAARLNIGLSSFVSIGNKADVSGNDLLQLWAEDPRTDVILLYLESFGNPRKFSQIARRVARHKPIVAVKAGRSIAGARAASSHTGALASSDAVVDALFRQAGVIRTNTLEELFDVATLLAHQPVPAGRRVAVLTNAGGPGILAADACEANGLEIVTLSESTLKELHAFLPPAASIANPVDMLASASADDYGRALRVLLADQRVDSVIVIFIPPLVTGPSAVAAAIVEATRGYTTKPILATVMRAQGAPPELAHLPCYMFPESAAAALARVATYGEWRRRPDGAVPVFTNLRADDVRAIVRRVLADGGGWLTPADVQDLLKGCGIAVAELVTVHTPAEAIGAARRLGFPVAVKAMGAGIVHKTEVGGVRLNLGDDAAVGRACRELVDGLGTSLSGFVVQQMIAGGVELLVGAIQDPTFGPVLACATGGTLVELHRDAVFRLHPLTDLDAGEMLNDVKAAVLLRGYRGAPAADEAAVRDVLLRVSALVDLCPEIHEIEINPLVASPQGACAVDARVRVERPRRVPSQRILY